MTLPDTTTWLIAVLLFGGVALFLLTLHAAFTGGDDSVKRRLVQLQKERAAASQEELPEWAKAIQAEESQQRVDLRRLIGKVTGISYVEKVDKALAQANIPMRVSEFILMRLLLVVGPPLIFGLILHNMGLGIAFSVLGFILPPLVLKTRSNARVQKFNNQLSEFLTLVVNALRAGQTFLQAADHASKESPEPIASEFKLVLQESNLGLPIEAAFQNLVQRVPSQDLEIAATAFVIQKNIGGNLAEVMEKVAITIRERVKLQGQIRVLTAQGMLSGWIVGLLPVLLGSLIYTLNPSYISLLFTTDTGQKLLGLGVILLICGALAIRKIVTIDV
jgi:tight adherence protein B